MNWIYYNPDKTNDGFECRYKIINGILYIESRGANSFWDWFKCIFWALWTCIIDGEKYHKYWGLLGFKFFRHIRRLNFQYVHLRGHSMGGAINDVVAKLLITRSKKVIFSHKTFGSPKASLNTPELGTNYYNKGDFVRFLPFWYKPGNRVDTDKKWRPVWISHKFYDWRFEE